MRKPGAMETTVRTWTELQDVLFEDSYDPTIQRYRSNFAFRGMVNRGWALETSLMRLGGPYAVLERALLRNFKKYAHQEQALGNSEWNWLSLAQHHGLPTRLMDWTYSPYVALHFATDDMRRMDDDGIIWCVDLSVARTHLPPLFAEVRERNHAYAFSVDMMNEVAESLESLQALRKDDFVVFFEPPSLDNRIVNQYALFSVMSRSEANLEDWLEQRRGDRIYRKIIIPASLKWEVRDKLDQANISERVLFGGLDGLCRWLRRHYSPGPGGETSLK
jgi:hypothetical protein